ncbi:MAG: Rab family GTPase [Candidatus Acidiferrales bacterium]
MVTKKVCIFGAHGVGKRSLTFRFRDNAEAERYRATIGVQICKRVVVVGNESVTMALWDVADLDPSDATLMNYSRGMSGYFLVADGTRPSTLERAREIYEQLCSFEESPPSVEEIAGAEPQANKPYVQFPYREVPFILLLNKSDEVEQWRIDRSNLEMLANKGWPVQVVSAKENEGVEEAFLSLGRRMMSQPVVKSQQ